MRDFGGGIFRAEVRSTDKYYTRWPRPNLSRHRSVYQLHSLDTARDFQYAVWF
jgi:hypothetical protein